MDVASHTSEAAGLKKPRPRAWGALTAEASIPDGDATHTCKPDPVLLTNMLSVAFRHWISRERVRSHWQSSLRRNGSTKGTVVPGSFPRWFSLSYSYISEIEFEVPRYCPAMTPLDGIKYGMDIAGDKLLFALVSARSLST